MDPYPWGTAARLTLPFRRGHAFFQEECCDQEVLKVLLKSKDRGVFNGGVLTDECLRLRFSLDQLLQFFPVLGDVADRSNRPRGVPQGFAHV